MIYLPGEVARIRDLSIQIDNPSPASRDRTRIGEGVALYQLSYGLQSRRALKDPAITTDRPADGTGRHLRPVECSAARSGSFTARLGLPQGAHGASAVRVARTGVACHVGGFPAPSPCAPISAMFDLTSRVACEKRPASDSPGGRALCAPTVRTARPGLHRNSSGNKSNRRTTKPASLLTMFAAFPKSTILAVRIRFGPRYSVQARLRQYTHLHRGRRGVIERESALSLGGDGGQQGSVVFVWFSSQTQNGSRIPLRSAGRLIAAGR